ncbi:MAG: response regulator [Bacteroidales bacterium]|nr:response regulator [Bacteroidales bacterium]MBN2820923.1 response regulator [Bacteroidales bacterium]
MQNSTAYIKILLYIAIQIGVSQALLPAQEKYLHLTEVDGLPRNITTCLEQDNFGYLWIGTPNGIARYDGNTFERFNTLQGAGVNYILNDSENNVWAGTDKGLYKYNRLFNVFEQVYSGYITKIQEDNKEIYFLMFSVIYKITNKDTTVVYQDEDIADFSIAEEGIWIGKSNMGIMLLSRENDFISIADSCFKNKAITYVNKIEDNLFVACFNGELFVLNKNRELEPLLIDNHNIIKNVTKIGNEIWVSTDGNGIIILDSELKHLRNINRDLKTEISINSNSIYDVFHGNSDEIWIATYGGGLTCILPDKLLFNNIIPEKGKKNSLVANEGTTVFIDEVNYYFGTNYGLSEWNIKTKQFKNISSAKLKAELKGSKVNAIYSDTNDNLWIGTYDGLLGKYTSDFKLIEAYHPCSSSSDEMQQIVDIQELDNGNLLILTQFRDFVLVNFNVNNGVSVPFELDYKGSEITYCLLNSIRKNQHNELVALISDKGLYHVNWQTNVLENRLKEMNNKINAYISDFYHSSDGKYWFATSANGLVCVSEDGKYYKKWTMNEGLPSNTLVRLESADDKYLWISTVSGISRFDMETGQMINFNHSDGLPANEFYERSSGKTNDGKIIFGSFAGFTLIDPSKIAPDTSIAKVIISDISFQGQSIRNIDKFLLDKPIEETTELWLPYNRNSFTIHFFTKAKSYIKKHSYAYRLRGLEDKLNYTSGTNYATYTSLSSGTYSFEIINTDKSLEGIPTVITIHIRAPWYSSWYAIIVYIFFCFTLIYLSVYAYLKRLQLRKEKEISEYKIQKEHELTEKKLAFFTSISHDLKTPLTLIDAPVNDLLQSENLSEEQVNKLKIVHRNSKRLYKLISDIIDFRKITLNQNSLKVRETNITELVFEVYHSFEEECKSKSLVFEPQITENQTGMLDAGKIEKILWNLVSNAIKFSDKGGKIVLGAAEIFKNEIRYLKLVVSDQGIGIAEENKSKIFDRFFKVDSRAVQNKGGTGIGLSIVKGLADLHHGTIDLESAPGLGTTFTILIPLDLDRYMESEIDQTAAYVKDEVDIFVAEEISSGVFSVQERYNLSSLLIVEDNVELREYLAEHFQKNYKVFQAQDGFIGLQKALELNPNLILTDVQMPNMDGYEFCSQIRQQFDTSHIPVIMLTANNTPEQQVQGLSKGADVYLTKPIDINILDAQVKSLLENRKSLRKKFKGVEHPENIEESLPKKDVDFILEFKRFIEENMMLQDLSVSSISKHLAISTAQLHRKIKALTDTTPNNLIKSIRLKKAYELIKEEGLRVAEAAYQTGFNDSNYFATCFKKEFGVNPSQIGNSSRQ